MFGRVSVSWVLLILFFSNICCVVCGQLFFWLSLVSVLRFIFVKCHIFVDLFFGTKVGGLPD